MGQNHTLNTSLSATCCDSVSRMTWSMKLCHMTFWNKVEFLFIVCQKPLPTLFINALSQLQMNHFSFPDHYILYEAPIFRAYNAKVCCNFFHYHFVAHNVKVCCNFFTIILKVILVRHWFLPCILSLYMLGQRWPLVVNPLLAKGSLIKSRKNNELVFSALSDSKSHWIMA